MVIEKKFFPSVKIYCGAPRGQFDLKKKWFVFHTDEQNKRHRRYGNINSFSTHDERLKAAEELRWKVLARHHKGFALKKRLADHVDQRFFREKKTRSGHISKVRCFLEWLGAKKLDQENCIDFFKYLLHNRHATTHNDYLIVLRKLFKEIKIQYLLEGIEKVKAISTPARYFQPHHQAQLRKYIEENDPELWLHIQFIYYCFIRPESELLPLKYGDILFDERKILIRGSNAKNDKQEYVGIPDSFYPYIKHFKYERPGDYVFPSPKRSDQPMSKNILRRRHRKILKLFGYDTKEYKLYSWKHTGAVAVVMAGVSVKQLQIQLRHHSLDQVDAYLRQLGINDIIDLRRRFPEIGVTCKSSEPDLLDQIRERLLLKYEDPKQREDFLRRVLAAA